MAMHSPDTTPALFSAAPLATSQEVSYRVSGPAHAKAEFDLARVRDLAIILFLAPALLLVGVLIAAAIFLDSPGPIFYRQKRIGYRGRPFEMLKFRKMKPHRDGSMLTSA